MSDQRKFKDQNMGILDEYFKYHEEYEAKYGQKIVILMQVGSFYETYAYDDGTKTVGNATEISALLNIILTSKNKGEPHSRSNPYLAGFPVIAYEKHRDVLLNNNYTIIRVDQKGPGKNVERYVAEVLSPGTNIDSSPNTTTMTNQIVDIYIECQRSGRDLYASIRPDDIPIIAGLSSIDVSTGKTVVCEVYSKDEDKVHAVHEIFRFLVSQHPREILISISDNRGSALTNFPYGEIYWQYIRESLELDKYPTVIQQSLTQIKDYMNVNYQKQFLTKVYSESFRQPNQDPGITTIRGKTTLLSNVKERDSETAATGFLGISNKRETITHPINPRIFDELNLERLYHGIVSFIILLQYCYEHNETIISRLSKPETTWSDQERHLILTHNSILQLNLLPSQSRNSPLSKTTHGTMKDSDSLFNVINMTSTSMGKRYLRSMLLNPLVSSEVLEFYYNMTDELISKHQDDAYNLTIDNLERYLRMIPDLDRLHRKLSLHVLKPKDLVHLIHGYSAIVELMKMIYNSGCQYLSQLFLDQELGEQFTECLNSILQEINLETLQTCELIDDKGRSIPTVKPFDVIMQTRGALRMSFEESYFHTGRDALSDEQMFKIISAKSQLEKICQHLNVYLKGSRGKMIEPPDFTVKRKVNLDDQCDSTESNEFSGVSGITWFSTTNHKAAMIKMSLKEIDKDLCGNLEFKTIKSETQITSEKIERYCRDILEIRTTLENYFAVRYVQLITKIANNYKFFNSVTRFVSILDFVKSNAKVAIKYRYFRPTIVSCEQPEQEQAGEASFCQFKDIRHPIIERLIIAEYITNDITLGDNPLGRLLFGMNSVGKSALLKAIGLNIIMAQAGMFTAGKLTYRPYSRILTRLSGEDDIFKGHSSFIVELNEIRSIMRNGDHRSLVLVDEVCRGTESISGTSIAIATILSLLEKRSSFLISTHLHQILEVDTIRKIPQDLLKINHLATTYTEENGGQLIYDRKLKEGPGEAVYGILVTKFLGFDKKFIEMAESVRKTLMEQEDELLRTKKSRYNKGLYMDGCVLCGKKSQETHHLREQHKSLDGKFIDHFHKNSLFNLVPLCHDCHHDLHQHGLKLVSKQTLNGNLLHVETSTG